MMSFVVELINMIDPSLKHIRINGTESMKLMPWHKLYFAACLLLHMLLSFQ